MHILSTGTLSKESSNLRDTVLRALAGVEDNIAHSSRAIQIQRVVRQYSEWTEAKGFLPSFPVETVALGAFLVDRVSSLNGSSKSVSGWLSCLQVFSTAENFPWLDRAGVIRINRIVKELMFLDENPTRRMAPLTQDIDLKIFDCELVSIYVKTLIRVGRETLMRGGELTSGLEVGDFGWSVNRESVTIQLIRTKTNRSGGGDFITIENYGPFSAVALLKKHFTKYNLWSQKNFIVFPSYTITKGFNWNKSMNIDQLRSHIRYAIKSIGLNPALFGAHSLRAGGATDLFRLGVYYPNIKRFGRWKSDSALLYYRDQEKVVKSVMEAFATRNSNSNCQQKRK